MDSRAAERTSQQMGKENYLHFKKKSVNKSAQVSAVAICDK